MKVQNESRPTVTVNDDKASEKSTDNDDVDPHLLFMILTNKATPSVENCTKCVVQHHKAKREHEQLKEKIGKPPLAPPRPKADPDYTRMDRKKGI